MKPKPSEASTSAANATCATVLSFDTISGFIGTGLPNNHDTITARDDHDVARDHQDDDPVRNGARIPSAM